MGRYSIKPNKNIFTAFVGLIASGYNLAENSCDKDIIDSIRAIEYDEDVIDYFKKARTSTCEVNPYWPRAFLLSLSGIFITEEPSFKYIDFQKMLNYIRSLQQINSNEINEELINWLKELPIRITELQNNNRIQEIWLKYILLVNESLFLLKPNLDEMIRYQYAWDYNEDSWGRVFEENFMRAAAIWVIFYGDINNAHVNANLHESYDFVYVPVIVEEFFSNWKGLDNFDGFIEDCLKACRDYL